MQRYVRDKVCVVLVLLAVVILMEGCKGEAGTEQIELVELQNPEEEAKEVSEKLPEEETKESSDEGSIYVHVCGEVVSPGVYELPAGSRLYEAVEAAGGLTEEASPDCLNQAAKAEDGQQVYVLSREEADAQGKVSGEVPGSPAGEADNGKVNLNTASKEQLMTLNGIGASRAEALMRYREENGGFRTTEEVMEVEGIKEGIFNKIKDQITV